MYSVTGRIRAYRQPPVAFLPVQNLERVLLDDGRSLSYGENIAGSLVGIAVDYLSRFMGGLTARSAFAVSLEGAYRLSLERLSDDERLSYFGEPGGDSPVDGVDRFLANAEQAVLAHKLLSGIKGLDDKSIINACKLAGYDVVARSSSLGFVPVTMIRPNRETIGNIRVMVERTLAFFEAYGPVLAHGFSFPGDSPAFRGVISSGDGDLITSDGLWDLKVSKRNPGRGDTLQLLIYYLMIEAHKPEVSEKIERLGIFNPRRHCVYSARLDTVTPEILDMVRKDVIGY